MMGNLAIGLAADCDNPEREVNEIMNANLPGATGLPFVAFITHDGKWVTGYSGFKNAGDFETIMKKADKSPYLQASKATRKKLAGLVKSADKAAARGDWKSVVKSGKAAEKMAGRCPERAQLKTLLDKAHRWANAELERALKLARSTTDVSVPRKVLMNVKSRFAGEVEADDASLGLKALRALTKVHKLESSGKAPADIREKSAAKFKGTRWAAVFSKLDGADEQEPQEEPVERPQEKENEESEIEVG